MEVLLPDDERRFSFPVYTNDATYDESGSQYVLMEVLGYEDDSEHESLFLMHHQFHESKIQLFLHLVWSKQHADSVPPLS